MSLISMILKVHEWLQKWLPLEDKKEASVLVGRIIDIILNSDINEKA